MFQIILASGVVRQLAHRYSWSKNESSYGLFIDWERYEGIPYVWDMEEIAYTKRRPNSFNGRYPPGCEGTLHSHPSGSCSFSKKDYKHFKGTRYRIHGIQYGERRFRFLVKRGRKLIEMKVYIREGYKNLVPLR